MRKHFEVHSEWKLSVMIMEFCTDYILYPHAVSLWKTCLRQENVFLYSFIHLFIYSKNIYWTQLWAQPQNNSDERPEFLSLWRNPESSGRHDDLNYSFWFTEKGTPRVLLGLRNCTWIKSEGIFQGKWDHHRLISTGSLHCFLQKP